MNDTHPTSRGTLRGTKVYVGISGGVDSSVALFLLKEQGYDVTGVYLRTWQPEWMECTWRDERRDAMRVCAHLNVPFVEHDVSEQYKERVAEYMINEYRAGRTPNPDVMCNKEIKFGEFFNWAMEQGADYVATGHYAQTREGNLLRGIDNSKDQSYFLWSLSSEVLRKTLFPLGGLLKSQVRYIAQNVGLPTAVKKDSQGICFIGDIGMKEFLSHYIQKQQGDVVNTSGEVIGHHDGALFFTVGERHGFTITKKTPEDPVLYILKKNIEKNTITVGPRESVSGISEMNNEKSISLSGVVFRESIQVGKTYGVEFRYHGKSHLCTVELKANDQAQLLCETEDTVAPGQSCVVYDGDLCIGGGIVS